MISRFEFINGFKRRPVATAGLGLGVLCTAVSIYAIHAQYSGADSQLAQAKAYSNGNYQMGVPLPESVVTGQPGATDNSDVAQQASEGYYGAHVAEALAVALALGDIVGATAITVSGVRDRALDVSVGAYVQRVYGASPDAPPDVVPSYNQ